MDEIDYKLRSQNPTLISHAISKLIEAIKKNLEMEEKDISKISEYKVLLSKCNSDDSIVSTSACQALVLLVESGLLDIKPALATFITCLCASKNYQAITIAVSQLLILDWKIHDQHNRCQYTLQVPTQHPFITILNQEKHSWRSVLNQMKFIMHHHDKQIIEQSMELLRPVFVYILCNPSMDLCDSCKREAWQLVIKSNDTSDLQTEILLWLCPNQVYSCVDTNCRLLELAEISLLKADKEYCTPFIPLIASLTIDLLQCGHEPVQNFCTILHLIEHCHDYIGDITIILMVEIIVICPAAYLLHVLQICKAVIEKMPCNIISLKTLIASLLKWLAYPSLLCSEALTIARELVTKITSHKKISNDHSTISNKLFSIFNYSNTHIQFYTELIHTLYTLKDDTLLWLNNLSHAPIDLKYMCKMILSGIFLHSEEPLVIQKTCHILVQIAKEINGFASHVLSLLLYKLTKSRDSSTSKYLLSAIPEFAGYKENLPIIIHTLNTLLNSGKPLKYLAIQLYIKALEREPRCYRFMSTALIDTIENDHSWHSNVTCARAIKYICENRPEHGEELVALLSQILNKCVDLNGGAASALALDSISALCKSAVIGIYSTWEVLAPKMRKEKRTVVLESLCELIADIPSYPFRMSEDYDKFITDILMHLWNYVICEDIRVAASAFKALKSYHIERIPLNALPLDFRPDLVLPDTRSKRTNNELEKPEDTALSYIPGTCWIQMLKKVNKTLLPMARDLLIFYIEEEVNSFRSRIYTWPQGEPHNFKYLSEKSVIRAVGEYLRRSDKSDPNNQKIIIECLRIFAHRYKKPLPNIKWDFLKEIMEISEEAKEYSLSIASRHSQISLSARLLMESYLSMYKSTSDAGQLLLSEKHIVFYSNLDQLCQTIQPNGLKQFLETSLDYVVAKILLNDEKSINLFNSIMSSYANALKSDTIHLGNRTLLSNMLEKLLDEIDLTSKHFAGYFTAVIELSAKDVERMTSPSVWWEVTPKKLKNAIAIRTELAFRKFIDTPLIWLNELIDVATSNPGMQMYLLEGIQRVQAELRFEQSCIDWILDFMMRIDTLMVESTQERNNILFYCDILIVSVICLSGMDCLLLRRESLLVLQDIRLRLFPQAILRLSDRQNWKPVIRQVMKWLNHMRTSSIPDVYKSAFQSSLILLRQEEEYNSQWTSYLSVKTGIYI